jgi:hypothetical protein
MSGRSNGLLWSGDTSAKNAFIGVRHQQCYVLSLSHFLLKMSDTSAKNCVYRCQTSTIYRCHLPDCRRNLNVRQVQRTPLERGHLCKKCVYRCQTSALRFSSSPYFFSVESRCQTPEYVRKDFIRCQTSAKYICTTFPSNQRINPFSILSIYSNSLPASVYYCTVVGRIPSFRHVRRSRC